MDFGSLGTDGPLKDLGDFAGALKSLFGGLGYFLGGDFQKALEKGFMA